MVCLWSCTAIPCVQTSDGRYFDLCTSIIKEAPSDQAFNLVLYYPEPQKAGMLCET